MEEQTFSLQFNPLQKIRTTKDYENEIEELRNENFGLKHQISHYRSFFPTGVSQEEIQKLLFDSKRSIDILEAENETLCGKVNNMQEIVRRVEEERKGMETRLSTSVREYANRASMLEDENNRLLKHLEGVNERNKRVLDENDVLKEHVRKNEGVITEQKNYIENILREKTSENAFSIAAKKLVNEERARFEKELISCRNALLNCTKEKDQASYEHKREIVGYNDRINRLQSLMCDLEKKISVKDTEMIRMRERCENMEREYNALSTQGKSGEMYLREMSENYMRETKEKQTLALKNEELMREVGQLRAAKSELNKHIEVIENEKRALSYKVSQDGTNGVVSELERIKRERIELIENLENKRKTCQQYSEHIEKLSKFLRDDVRKQTVDCARRIGEAERIAFEMSLKVNSIKDKISFCGNEGRVSNYVKNDIDVEHEKKIGLLRLEIKDLRKRVEAYRKMIVIGEDNRHFLRSLNVDPSMPLDEVVGKLKSSYLDLSRRAEVMEKDVFKMTNGGKSGKGGMHGSTERLLDGFMKEFEIARKDLEVCKKYLKKKNSENKELKTDKLKLERRFDECRKSEDKIRALYSMMVNDLKKKNEVISELEMRMETRH